MAWLALWLGSTHEAEARPLRLFVDGAGALPVGAPQSRHFGPGAAVGAGLLLPLWPWFQAGTRLRALALSGRERVQEAGRVAPGTGTLVSLGAMLRGVPFGNASERHAQGLFVDGALAIGVTGVRTRATVEVGVGYGIPLATVALLPALRFLQVVQPSDPLSSEDARIALLGLEVLVGDRPEVSGPEAVGVAPVPQPLASADQDGDGLADREDACATDPEDRDGHEDDDGCPDSDNDNDEASGRPGEAGLPGPTRVDPAGAASEADR